MSLQVSLGLQANSGCARVLSSFKCAANYQGDIYYVNIDIKRVCRANFVLRSACHVARHMCIIIWLVMLGLAATAHAKSLATVTLCMNALYQEHAI
jgi:hypothetical protein